MPSIKQRVLGLVGDRLFAGARIVATSDPAPRFRMLDIRSDALAGRTWLPGSKIQIDVGAWVTRTYTPIPVDVPQGVFRIMVWLHADGPGAKWASVVRAGVRCRLLGPRPSLRVSDDARPLVIHGDETAIPMAAAFRQARGDAGVRALFETEDAVQAEAAARALGVADAHFFPKRDGKRALLDALMREAQDRPDAWIVLAGRATSVREARAHLRDHGVATARLRIKVYWADGRTGLD